MRAILQRIEHASVVSDGVLTGNSAQGLMILLGVHKGDSDEDAQVLAKKIANLRIFSDDQGKLNKSILDVQGQALIVSNFTLYANYKKGNRPDYFDSEVPDKAIPLYELFISSLKSYGIHVETGVFGADMKVSMTLDGPVTIVMDSELLLK